MLKVGHHHRKGKFEEPATQGIMLRDLRYADDTIVLTTVLEGFKI